MKIAPLMHALENHPAIEAMLVHTGQHYDEKMSHSFFEQLNIPEPHINLEVGSASHAVQTATIMERFEVVCMNEQPDMVMVVGDVNSTAACSLVAAKLHIQVAHYEAGLRSRDRDMPEEINRLVTDAISDLFITTSKDASQNLLDEGVSEAKIHMLGNLMIDSLVEQLEKAQAVELKLTGLSGESIQIDFNKPYTLMTFHRPSNVDDEKTLSLLVDEWIKVSELLPVVFPIHPRTQAMLEKFGLMERLQAAPDIYLTGPLAYFEFLKLMAGASLVITDSGGIQEETTYLKIPCLTVRPTTERPVTIWEGSNQLIKANEIYTQAEASVRLDRSGFGVPQYWDGQAASRIIKLLEQFTALN
ncbi:MAG: UDP-N-acetylglucosamine 2-epimerase (non-hydrolyzing) [Candidatus Marinimicrobia bacterium]|nr:UDP-N-acetylglucosamine 2-epimerase (non-hydrolyzing) [Candidatus Neomarinimicrobiota bacterium]MCF7851602.1 UDP-N-acetylglucosamine 2-epimerase (non-hydrolyzing) [Candidatus Neomarinimicrobiota bacterium]MCF7905404.1 UDP-N-acetylglucosamine 2-epimerase (non-hydrolyzing) [Candidatus Neomarinimicrobiota bacterium]